jgi:hypothetical protein
MTQQNAAMVDQSSTASHARASEAEALAELVSQFTVGAAIAASVGAGAMRSKAGPEKESVRSSQAADSRPLHKVVAD